MFFHSLFLYVYATYIGFLRFSLYINFTKGYSVSMTLRLRNRFLRVFVAGTSLAAAAVLIAFVFLFFTGGLSSLRTLPRAIDFSFKSALFEYNLYVSIVSLILLMLFVPASGIFLISTFEKTQSPEVIYYAGFLAGCFLQTIRLSIPLFDLWIGYSSFLVFTARANFAGQIICALCLWFASFFSDEDSVQEADRNLAIALATAVLFSLFIPVNPATLNSAFLLSSGYKFLFELIFIILFLVSFFAFIIRGKQRNMISCMRIAVLFLVFFTGYRILSLSDSLFTLITGAGLLYTGSFLFLNTLHKYYLWK